MKSVMKNYKSLAVAAFAALSLTVASTNSVLANEDGSKPKSNIDLKFIGNIEDQPVFQLKVNNTENDEFTVTFRDEQNNVLYVGKLKGVNIVKNFQLSTEDAADANMSVEVKSVKTSKTEVYKINKTRNYTEEVVVNKL